MLGLKAIDWLVIGAYLVGITMIGVWAARRVKDAASYFIGDRKFGKIMMIFFMFGSGTHSDQAVSVAAKTYQSGASGIWYQWLWLPVTPFFWLIAPVFRRMRAVTTADYFHMRYGRSVSVLYAIIGMLQLTVTIGLMLKGSSAMVTAVSGGAIDPLWAIGAMTVMFVVYGMAGGMSAAIATDFVQGILTVFFSFLLLPFAMREVGGVAGLHERLPEAVLQIVAPGEITLFYIAVLAFNALIGWVTQPHIMAVCGAGRTELEGRLGATAGMFGKRICTIAWMLTGLAAVALYAGQGLDKDHVYGQMARDLLPTIAPGLVGLFIASMLASVMSSCDAFMVASSGLFTENIYRPLLVRNASEQHYLWVGRIVSALVVGLGIYFALQWQSVVEGLETFWMIAALMGIPFWVGLVWRRATAAGAWAGTLVSFGVLLFTSEINIGDMLLWDFNVRFADQLPQWMLWEGSLYLPWQMILYLAAGFVTLVIVSLFTRPEDTAALNRLYECLRTPVEPGEETGKPFTLPAGREPAPRSKMLLTRGGFEIPRPSLAGVLGFVLSWGAVWLLIKAVYWILQV